MLCPDCKQTLDDADERTHVCAAAALQRWRCEACGQAHQGFAFAYGRCPGCGGALVLAEGAPPAATTALHAIRSAFEIELGGRAFYQRAAADCSDPSLKALFSRFALMEGEHMETLARRYRLDVPAPSPDFRLEVAAIFARVEHRPQDPGQLFEIALALEERAAEYFAARATDAGIGREQQQLLRELAAEELEHAAVLRDEYARWRKGVPGRFSVDLLGRPLMELTAADDFRVEDNAAVHLLGAAVHDKAALVCGSTTLSYDELRERVQRTAGYWRQRGIRRGDRIAIKLCDGIDWVTAFLGALWAGAVAVPVNPRVPAPEWAYILDEAGFSLILVEPDDDTPEPWRQRTLSLADFHQGQQSAAPVAALAMDPRAPAFWCHSSGTSGKPKAVIHAHRFAQTIEQVSRDGLGITGDDRLFASSKLFFSYPQTNSLWAGFKLGATVIVDPTWPTASHVLQVVVTQRPTVLLSVPSLYRNLLNEGHAAAIARAGVRLCVSAGEALPPSLRDEWLRQTGLTIVNGYGASETLVLAMLDRGDGRGFAPSPGVDIQPLEALKAGLPSRLLIRAGTIALGYLDRPQAQAENFRDEAFCPADLFAFDPDSGWRFAGREDSLVKIHGRWVNLVELEERLAARTDGLKEAAAVLVPDADGVDAVAFFFAAGNESAVSQELQDRANALPPHQRPRWWHVIDSLPRGPTGKLLRRKLQDLHREREAGT